MNICFWVFCAADIILIVWFAYTLFASCLNRVVASKSLNDIIAFLLSFAGIVWLLISAVILYASDYLKIATVLAFIPFLIFLYKSMAPVLFSVSNKTRN